MDDYQTILVERADGITTISFNRPEKRNAMNPLLHREMYDALTRLEGDDETRVLVLTGSGTAFCAGQDLKEYFKETEGDGYQRNLNRRISNDWRDRILKMFPRPTIAMVNGYCFGGAFTIVAACDFAIAAEEAVFGLSEVNWGAIPGGLVAKVISGQIAYRDALYYAMTGEKFDGRRAAEIRFVNRAVPLGQLRSEVTTLALKLASMDAAALRATKMAFKQVVDMTNEQAYWWLAAKSNELRLEQVQEGTADDGIDRFLAKEYRPGLGSHTDVNEPGR
jgi:trans-feruloyl-CoA hydratase/vanillin synthase